MYWPISRALAGWSRGSVNAILLLQYRMPMSNFAGKLDRNGLREQIRKQVRYRIASVLLKPKL
ncbi:MAG TPA: hypothetical protein VMB49_17125 [Acidobacteriaceae bacterium]|nr:hypothetical protein [Acidobacteriaceae bacterium]